MTRVGLARVGAVLGRRFVRAVQRELLAAWAPAGCACCGGAVGDPLRLAVDLCLRCSAGLEPLLPGVAAGCPRCGEALPAPGGRCAGGHREIRGLGFAAAPFRYRGTCGGLVRRLKFRGEPAALEVMGCAMAAALGPAWARSLGSFRGAPTGPLRRAVIVPVPLHRSRARQRKWDQAALLAGVVARSHRLPMVRALARIRATRPQGDPQVLDRDANVRGAFRCRLPAEIHGRWVVLVDDVATSGATARACGDALRTVGAAGVVLLTAARARRWA